MTLTDKVSAPMQTSKHAMCASPILSMLVIGGGYGMGKISGPVGGMLSGAMTAAILSSFSEFVVTREHSYEHKMNVIASQSVLGAVAGVAGGVIPF